MPSVRQTQKALGDEPKVILFLDNCSAHPDASEISTDEGKIVAYFFPPNVTSILQPMDQGVLETLKRRYKRDLMRYIVVEIDSNPNFSWDQFMKSIDFLNVIRMISAAWAPIETTLIQKSWKHLGLNNESENTPEDNAEPDIQALLHILAPDADFGVQID